MKNEEFKKGEIVIYKAKGGPLIDVRLQQETVWLTQKQMSELFDTERSVITKHLRNIFDSGELEEKSNVQKMHIANSDKPVALYNLDMIISVGYRVIQNEALNSAFGPPMFYESIWLTATQSTKNA
jgi:hypothetical protein